MGGQEKRPRSGIREDDSDEGRRVSPLPAADGARVNSAAGSSGSEAWSPATCSTGMKPEAELRSFVCSQKMWHRNSERDWGGKSPARAENAVLAAGARLRRSGFVHVAPLESFPDAFATRDV